MGRPRVLDVLRGRGIVRRVAAPLIRMSDATPWACRVRVRGAANEVARPRSAGRPSLGNRVTISGDRNLIELDKADRLSDTRISISGNGNRVHLSGTMLRGLSISVTGNDNRVHLNGTMLRSLSISGTGNANDITFAEGCVVIHSACMVCQGDSNVIAVGANTQMHGTVELAALEGTRISVGEGCLFSGGIHVRTGDSHSVLDNQGLRANPARDIELGDRVWVGRNVTILKGARLGDDSIAAASAVVTKRFDEDGIVVAGNPAKIVKRDVTWQFDLVS